MNALPQTQPEAAPPTRPKPSLTSALPPKRRASRVWKRLLGALLLLLAAAALVWAWAPQPIPVDIARVQRTGLHVTVDEDGRTRVKDRYVISSPLLASVARSDLTAGDSVREGQLLARLLPLEPPLLDTRTRAQSERRVASALAARKQAESALARASTLLEFAQSETARQRALSQQGATAGRALENAEVQERTAHEEHHSAQFALRVAGYEVEMAQLNLARQSGQAAGQEQIELLSPVAGQVLKLIQQSAGVVQPGAPLLELGDVRALEIVVDVLTSDAVNIQPRARAWIERWGGDRALSGHVRSIEPSAFTRISALGVEEQRVNVIIDLDEPRAAWEALGDGYRVEVRILTWSTDSALVAPESAIFRRSDSWAAFTVQDGKVEIVPVEVGHRNGEQAEILKGLSEGTQVIVHPSERVTPGAKVTARAQSL